MTATPDGSGNSRTNRDRILEASLELFNERGALSVSTKTIAAHLGISPGNLYYHFKDKEHIIRELWQEAEDLLMPAMAVPPEDFLPAPDFLATFFQAFLEDGWLYRFITRDIDELVSRDPVLAEHTRSRMEWGRAQLLATFDALITHEAMSPPSNRTDLDRICTNLQLNLMNWTRFLVTARGKTKITKHDLAEGALHAFLLIEPYLTPDYARPAREALEKHLGSDAGRRGRPKGRSRSSG